MQGICDLRIPFGRSLQNVSLIVEWKILLALKVTYQNTSILVVYHHRYQIIIGALMNEENCLLHDKPTHTKYL